MRKLIILLLSMLCFLIPRSGQAQAPTETTSVVTIHVLDANNLPLPGVEVALTLLRYGQTVEEIPSGNCTTDQTGTCWIEVADPPRMSDGYVRARLIVGEFGQQTIGWYGEQVEVTVLVTDLALAATVSAPLEGPYEGQDQVPTDAPLSPATTTSTHAASPTATQSPSSPTPAATTTSLPQPVTPTATPMSPSAGGGNPTVVVWLLLGLVVFGLFGWRIAAFYRQQGRGRK